MVKLNWGQGQWLTISKTAKYNPASNSSKPKWRKAKYPSKGHSAEEPQPGQAFVSSPGAKPQECGLCCPFFQLPDCSSLPVWAKPLLRTMAALLEEGQLSAQLEKQRFAHTPVWCTAEGTKYHRNCWPVDFGVMQLFSPQLEAVLLHV